MSCERYQKLLHLNRSGELSHHEADELRQHVRLCERCALELQRIERADGFIDRLGAFSRAHSNPEKLTADILRRVRAESTTARPFGFLDRLLEFFLIPSVRYSTMAIILIVTVTFMAQLLMVMDDITGLEQRMASSGRNRAAEATYTVQSKTLQDVATSERGTPLKDNVSLTVTNDKINVRAQDVDTFLSGHDLKSLPTILGATALHIDKKTLDKIVNEVKATAELTFRKRHEGA